MDNTLKHPVDVIVGARITQRRNEINVSQMLLADAIGVTYQQIQKYEKARNRVSASRLFQIAAFLKVPVTYFFKGARKPKVPVEVVQAEAANG